MLRAEVEGRQRGRYGRRDVDADGQGRWEAGRRRAGRKYPASRSLVGALLQKAPKVPSAQGSSHCRATFGVVPLYKRRRDGPTNFDLREVLGLHQLPHALLGIIRAGKTILLGDIRHSREAFPGVSRDASMHASSRKHTTENGMARGASRGTMTRGPDALHSRVAVYAPSRPPFGSACWPASHSIWLCPDAGRQPRSNPLLTSQSVPEHSVPVQGLLGAARRCPAASRGITPGRPWWQFRLVPSPLFRLY